mmetsp:Transcript_6221/g.10350  ORF Transcript_6221/g.10350 Transcript_6221/m.10350 type:complete len:169 (+) Transcript_6221:145-651(+)
MSDVKELNLGNEAPEEVVNRLLACINAKFAGKWLKNPSEELNEAPNYKETGKDRKCKAIFGNDTTLQKVIGVLIKYYKQYKMEIIGLNFYLGGAKRELDIQRSYPGQSRNSIHQRRREDISVEWTSILEKVLERQASSSSSSSFSCPIIGLILRLSQRPVVSRSWHLS